MKARNVSSAEKTGDARQRAATRAAEAEAQRTTAIVRAVSEHLSQQLMPFVPAYMPQVDAATYLGVSVRYFRDFVDVEPIPFPGSGEKPVERYAVKDLDAWAEKWRDPKARRSA